MPLFRALGCEFADGTLVGRNFFNPETRAFVAKTGAATSHDRKRH